MVIFTTLEFRTLTNDILNFKTILGQGHKYLSFKKMGRILSLFGFGRVRNFSVWFTGYASQSTTRVFIDLEIDRQPAGRIIFKIYDDLPGFTSPYAQKFIQGTWPKQF